MALTIDGPGPLGMTVRSVAVFVVGNLIGALIAQLIPTAKPDNGNTLYLVGFLVLVAVIAIAYVELGVHQSRRLKGIETSLVEATTKLGKVAELHTDTSGDLKGRHFDHLADKVKEAPPGSEICVLTYYGRKVEDRIADGPYADARDRYMNALLEAVERGVFYKRILCFERSITTDAARIEFIPTYTRDHCLKMLDLPLPQAKFVSIKKASAVLTADIIVIAHALGAISVERLETNDRHYGGAIVVYDPPNHRIVTQLREWWEEAYKDSAPLTHAELQIATKPRLPAPA
jgi:hypothetical protein